ncbi:MAG: translation initiation factor IF-5A [Candidatus Diapherotrites archaeon]|uniref:Translation initiation factor IF-5A n=1 Tax=Candidatus Iainarchaeum sp. TaxID=3101447 RepID=A0A8T3YKY3_9ARCH|nr:translation initiation factor IF-5A [Candidatus Diapherotrites archaeon]
MADGEKRFQSAGTLKPGSYVLIDGEPCQVKGIEKSKPGKHGAAKVRMSAFSIFSDQKMNLMKPTDYEAEIPIIEKGSAQVVALMGSTVQIMDVTDYKTYDVEKPKDVQGIAGGTEVEFIKWGDKVRITRKKGEGK